MFEQSQSSKQTQELKYVEEHERRRLPPVHNRLEYLDDAKYDILFDNSSNIDQDEGLDDEVEAIYNDEYFYSFSADQLSIDVNASIYGNQLSHIIITSNHDIIFTSGLRESKYNRAVKTVLMEWLSINYQEILPFINPRQFEKIKIHNGQLYSEILKNSGNLNILLPTLHMIKLKDIILFKSKERKLEKKEKIIEKLCTIYFNLEPNAMFSAVGEEIDKRIDEEIPGIKGRRSKYFLYIKAIERFYAEFKKIKYDTRVTYTDLKNNCIKNQKYNKKFDDLFLKEYGESLWEKLREETMKQ